MPRPPHHDPAPAASPQSPALSAFAEHLGVQAEPCETQPCDGARLQLRLGPQHHNGWGTAHGGVLMSLCDVAMAHALRRVLAQERQTGASLPGVVTLEQKTAFLRAAQGDLTAHATLLHRSATLAYLEASVADASGARCAHATATYRLLPALPVGRQARASL